MHQNKKKYVILICLIIMVIIGTSYALWIQNLYQEDENTMATSCFNITLEEADAISLKNAYPIYDEDGKKLTPYTFTIKNNCEAYATYQVNLEVLNSSTLTNPEYIKVMLNGYAPILLSSKEEVTKTIDNAKTAYKLDVAGLDVNESKTYELRLWIDEDVTLEDNIENSKFIAQIGITAAYSEEKITAYDLCIQKYGNDSAQCQILLAESVESLCPTVNADGTVVKPSAEISQSLLCAAPDDYGTSYYFRGVPENNWVKFGGYYWRIIRINGDDSIRMIYAGDASVIDALDEEIKVTVMSNGYDDSSTFYTRVGTSVYNRYRRINNVIFPGYIYADNAGLGYMYGNVEKINITTVESNTDTLLSTDIWYVAKNYEYNEESALFTLKDPIAVLGSELENYIGYFTLKSELIDYGYTYAYQIVRVTPGDSEIEVGYKYVNYGTTSKEKAQENINNSDIKLYIDTWYETNLASYSTYISDTLFCNDRTLGNNINSYDTQLAYGMERTRYRWYSSSSGIRLLCSQKNDRFTVDDEVIGNGDLTYSIGLLATDEAYLAGGSAANNQYYLYTGYEYWTMSPYNYVTVNASIRTVTATGMASGGSPSVNNAHGIRPIINLKPNVLKSGDGTTLNPYKIEE